MNKNLIIILFSLLSLNSKKTWGASYPMSGNFENRVINYTDNSGSNLGHYSFFQFEQRSNMSSSTSGINQLRLNATSIEEDIKTKSSVGKKAIFDAYLGENYFRYQQSKYIFQVGFQEVVWGESFGFNYADIINPKDNRMTFYSDQGQSRIPILLVNTKLFIPIGSVQVLFGPRPQFSKTLPLDLFISDILPQSTIQVEKEKTPDLFDENDYGAKLSTSFKGLDLSFFYFDFLDRNPYYVTNLQKTSLTNLSLNEYHARTKSMGFSFAKTIYDFILRSDYVYSQNKTFNYFENLSLKNYQSNTTEIILSLDTPTVKKYTGYFIFAQKNQDNFFSNSFTPQSSQYFITKFTRSLSNEKNLEMSYTREIKTGGNSVQALLNWPVNNTTEIRFGGEFYFGDVDSSFSKIKKLNNVFFSIKNFFQI